MLSHENCFLYVKAANRICREHGAENRSSKKHSSQTDGDNGGITFTLMKMSHHLPSDQERNLRWMMGGIFIYFFMLTIEFKHQPKYLSHNPKMSTFYNG